MKQVNKKELCKILGIGKETLKSIEKENRLEIRLENIGYKLLNRYKVGKSIMYDIELDNAYKETYSNIVNTHFKTNKTEQFGLYFKTRTENSINDIPISKKDIANVSNVSVSTIEKWDNISIKENIIKQDDFYYMLIDCKTRTIKRVTYEYYCSFWKARAEDKKTDELTELFNKGLISLDELLEHVRKVSSFKQAIEQTFCFRIKRYNLDDNNQLYKIINSLLPNILTEKECVLVEDNRPF